MGKRELIALLNLSSWCLVMVERLFLVVPRGSLQFVIVVFPDHTHLLFLVHWLLKSYFVHDIYAAVGPSRKKKKFDIKHVPIFDGHVRLARFLFPHLFVSERCRRLTNQRYGTARGLDFFSSKPLYTCCMCARSKVSSDHEARLSLRSKLAR